MLVTLLGAGPGDPGLLTLNGVEALEKCDVVVFDALANKDFLKFAPDTAEKIYVGKIASNHALSQTEINALLVRKARENGGQRVVRLKGGDPFIFGRGGEEALYLREAGVPFDIVPGISSAVAVPAYAGIPLTHRGLTSSLTILTGHENPEKDKSAINWKALAESGSTLVFVMGMKNLDAIVDCLINAGLAEDTAAAVIYRGTTPAQKAVFAPLCELGGAVRQAGISHPALIVIGKVVTLAPEMSWFVEPPLAGRTIIVTRAREQASELAASLIKLGADVIQFPTIKIKPLEDSGPLDAALDNLQAYRWLVFTSVNGVKFFWDALQKRGLDSRALAGLLIAAIGSGTASALARKGITPDLIPADFIAESLASAIVAAEGGRMENCRVLLPRARQARNALPDTLAAKGAVVDVVPVYETVPDTSGKEEALSLLRANGVDCVTFGSSSTVRNFFASVPVEVLLEHPEIRLAVIGPITANTLAEYGLKASIMPDRHDMPGFIASIAEYFSTGNLENG